MTKIVVLFPGNDCDEYTCASSQDVFVVDKKQWEEIVEYFCNNYYEYSPFDCGCGYSVEDYIEDCQIIEENPSDEIINFATKIQHDHIIDVYRKNKLLDDKKKLLNIIDRIGHFKDLELMDKNMANAKLQKDHEIDKETRKMENKISCQKGIFII
ncbi:putative orfan [Tupanvirus soda lake]|uniref:Orfan n=2 Tax=Tupanvirus TaxID=2094720 RepID=A0AC62AC13_9VIRU|nr:putative orfan [Tupanvirus soda lake]QKU35279.1 putative orfan [Tupanvirus soda lake]